jgi:hypothetical protein
MLPPPVIEEHAGYLVVRDDLIPGGTKQRAIAPLLSAGDEFVYAGPAFGYAQIALAHGCRIAGKKATVFVAKRDKPHKRTLEAAAAGAKIVQVPYGYLSNVQCQAREYCMLSGASLLPFGMDHPEFLAALTEVARGLNISPAQVWSVAGSGTLTRALQAAWPEARFFAVVVGGSPDVGRAHAYYAPEPFEKDAREPPPFPSCSNYDAKAWRLLSRLAPRGSLFWNVAA